MTLDEQLDEISQRRDRSDMQPTIDALEKIYQVNPDNPRVLYEMGGAYDTAGNEETAREFYERALASGLDGDILRRCYIQYGSTLRNLHRIEDSLRIFDEARGKYPASASIVAFQAITQHAAGNPNESIAILLELVADHIDDVDINRYKPALRGNANHIRSLA
ncbi:tetratricopeptide (TPR) repeat protein [Microbacterium resistens]|uniref:Tetratricopeptide (TPR) repeat protein n=1 Tax=Microbacterium resistens TaxID=156977 RepID=A0ABU1SF34_9MICO|nr:tetratricopeptide repeat protein [Microbacterium resistens]MDR6868201.1 tetratricopeptide (TPR) repeat protein [Microbacterium resistens]